MICRRRRDPALGAFLVLAVVLGCFFTYPVQSFAVLALVLLACAWAVAAKRKPAPVVRQIKRPVPGADWCDHCAEWTVHQTAQHARV